MSAWETSRLESLLKGLGRDTIINTGAWTNMAVEHLARTGADKGYFIIQPEDCCSTMNAEWHNASINFAMQECRDRHQGRRRHQGARMTESEPHTFPVVSRGRNWPKPGSPTTLPSSATTLPRSSVFTGQPVTSMPS